MHLVMRTPPERILLASRSPRRLALLRAAGFDVLVYPADCDEVEQPGELPVEHARRLAETKLEVARRTVLGPATGWWLGADTVVWLPGGETLGKPRDRDEARAMLQRLTAGEPHDITTGWAIARDDDPPEVHHETTRVWMRSLEAETLEAYLDAESWVDKAGGYGIQDEAASWVTRIEGSYTNVVGLPVAQVIERLIALSGTEGDERS